MTKKATEKQGIPADSTHLWKSSQGMGSKIWRRHQRLAAIRPIQARYIDRFQNGLCLSRILSTEKMFRRMNPDESAVFDRSRMPLTNFFSPNLGRQRPSIQTSISSNPGLKTRFLSHAVDTGVMPQSFSIRKIKNFKDNSSVIDRSGVSQRNSTSVSFEGYGIEYPDRVGSRHTKQNLKVDGDIQGVELRKPGILPKSITDTSSEGLKIGTAPLAPKQKVGGSISRSIFPTSMGFATGTIDPALVNRKEKVADGFGEAPIRVQNKQQSIDSASAYTQSSEMPSDTRPRGFGFAQFRLIPSNKIPSRAEVRLSRSTGRRSISNRLGIGMKPNLNRIFEQSPAAMQAPYQDLYLIQRSDSASILHKKKDNHNEVGPRGRPGMKPNLNRIFERSSAAMQAPFKDVYLVQRNDSASILHQNQDNHDEVGPRGWPVDQTNAMADIPHSSLPNRGRILLRRLDHSTLFRRNQLEKIGVQRIVSGNNHGLLSRKTSDLTHPALVKKIYSGSARYLSLIEDLGNRPTYSLSRETIPTSMKPDQKTSMTPLSWRYSHDSINRLHNPNDSSPVTIGMDSTLAQTASAVGYNTIQAKNLAGYGSDLGGRTNQANVSLIQSLLSGPGQGLRISGSIMPSKGRQNLSRLQRRVDTGIAPIGTQTIDTSSTQFSLGRHRPSNFTVGINNVVDRQLLASDEHVPKPAMVIARFKTASDNPDIHRAVKNSDPMVSPDSKSTGKGPQNTAWRALSGFDSLMTTVHRNIRLSTLPATSAIGSHSGQIGNMIIQRYDGGLGSQSNEQPAGHRLLGNPRSLSPSLYELSSFKISNQVNDSATGSFGYVIPAGLGQTGSSLGRQSNRLLSTDKGSLRIGTRTSTPRSMLTRYYSSDNLDAHRAANSFDSMRFSDSLSTDRRQQKTVWARTSTGFDSLINAGHRNISLSPVSTAPSALGSQNRQIGNIIIQRHDGGVGRQSIEKPANHRLLRTAHSLTTSPYDSIPINTSWQVNDLTNGSAGYNISTGLVKADLSANQRSNGLLLTDNGALARSAKLSTSRPMLARYYSRSSDINNLGKPNSGLDGGNSRSDVRSEPVIVPLTLALNPKIRKKTETSIAGSSREGNLLLRQTEDSSYMSAALATNTTNQAADGDNRASSDPIAPDQHQLDVDEMADKVWRKLMRKFKLEQERIGWNRWT